MSNQSRVTYSMSRLMPTEIEGGSIPGWVGPGSAVVALRHNCMICGQAWAAKDPRALQDCHAVQAVAQWQKIMKEGESTCSLAAIEPVYPLQNQLGLQYLMAQYTLQMMRPSTTGSGEHRLYRFNESYPDLSAGADSNGMARRIVHCNSYLRRL